MFFKQSSIANEIEASVSRDLPSEEADGLGAALESLAKSAESFEDLGMNEEAEVLTQFMETIASGQFAMVKEAKKKAKKSPKKKSPKKSPKKEKDEATDGLTPDRELKNLAEIGWVFNLPGAIGLGKGDGECGCSMADDGESDKAFSEYFPEIKAGQ